MSSINYKLFLKDIRFWIFISFVIRLINIDMPVIDAHSWRQADGYAMARNFYEISPNIFYPRIDHAGNLSGIMGSEFPLLNYLTYWLYLIFGVDWWQGRLINLVASVFGAWFFYRIVHDYIKKEVAFNATIFLLVSIWFAHSRKFMPDVFSASLVITGLYFGWRFMKDNKGFLYLFLFALFCMFGLLSKLPAFVVTALIFPAIFDRSILLERKVYLVIITGLLLAPVIYWYFVWAPHLTETFGFYYFYMGSSISESLHFLITQWPGALNRFYYDGLSFSGFILFILGIILVMRKKEGNMLLYLFSSFFLMILFLLKAGESFVTLSYYIVPFVPAMCILAAYPLTTFRKDWIKIAVVLVVAIEGIGNQQHDLKFRNKKAYLVGLEDVADQYTQRNDLVAINNGVSNPDALYLAHRKGWAINSGDTIHLNILEKIKNDGCKLIIWDKNMDPKPKEISYFEYVDEDDNFAFYRAR